MSALEAHARALEAEVQRLRDEREHVRRAACMALGTDESALDEALKALIDGRADLITRLLGAHDAGAL